MTKEEWMQFLKMAKAKGYSGFDIAKMLSRMFADGKLGRDQLLALLESIGYGLSDELQAMDDDELRKNICL